MQLDPAILRLVVALVVLHESAVGDTEGVPNLEGRRVVRQADRGAILTACHGGLVHKQRHAGARLALATRPRENGVPVAHRHPYGGDLPSDPRLVYGIFELE